MLAAILGNGSNISLKKVKNKKEKVTEWLPFYIAYKSFLINEATAGKLSSEI